MPPRLHRLPWEPGSECDSYSFLPPQPASFLLFGEKRWSFLVSQASKIETFHLGNAQADPVVHFSVLCINFFGLCLHWLCHIHQQIMGSWLMFFVMNAGLAASRHPLETAPADPRGSPPGPHVSLVHVTRGLAPACHILLVTADPLSVNSA